MDLSGLSDLEQFKDKLVSQKALDMLTCDLKLKNLCDNAAADPIATARFKALQCDQAGA